MFIRINIERARNRMSVKDLAAASGIKYATLLPKLNGKSEFTLSEMLKVQSAFPDRVPLEVLFDESQTLPPS